MEIYFKLQVSISFFLHLIKDNIFRKFYNNFFCYIIVKANILKVLLPKIKQLIFSF